MHIISRPSGFIISTYSCSFKLPSTLVGGSMGTQTSAKCVSGEDKVTTLPEEREEKSRSAIRFFIPLNAQKFLNALFMCYPWHKQIMIY